MQEERGELIAEMRIEGLSLAWENLPPRQKVTLTITEERLPLYQQAGQQTGYEVKVLARAGQSYITHERKIDGSKMLRHSEKLTDTYEYRTIKVADGHVGISIINWDPQRDHSPFWRACRILEDPLTSSK